MKRLFCACAVLALPACDPIVTRGVAVPVDYHRDTVLYQASCLVEPDIHVLNTPVRIGTPDQRCRDQAAKTCGSDYHIVHRTYGEAHWRLLNASDIARQLEPRQMRAQDLTIDFVCVGSKPQDYAIHIPSPADDGDFTIKP